MTRATDPRDVQDLLDQYSSGKWVNLSEDGETFIGAFMGDPVATEVTGFGKDTREYDSSVHSGGKPRFQGYWNIVSKETGEMKIMKLNTRHTGQLLKDQKTGVIRSWYTFSRHEFGPERTDVRYKLEADSSRIPDQEWSRLQQKPLWDLLNEAFGNSVPEPTIPNPYATAQIQAQLPAAPAPPPPGDGSNGQTIDAQTARKIWESCQQLPEASIKKAWTDLHSQLGIADINKLPQRRLAEAKQIFLKIKSSILEPLPPPPPEVPAPPATPPTPMAEDLLSAKQQPPPAVDPWGD